MRALARLERIIQELVERPAWLLTQRRLHPIEMAAVLTRALETDALPLADRVLAPDSYALRLHADDYAQFSDVRRTLEREYADYLTRVVAERGLVVNAPIRVVIVESGAVRSGTVEVESRFTEARVAQPVLRSTPPARTVTDLVAHRPAGAPPQPSRPVLEVLAEDGTVLLRRPLADGRLVIGRRSSNGLALADAEVSRHHAEIVHDDAAGFSMRDLDSMNGTIVNGRRIDGPHPLRDGDLIEIGHTRLRFVQGG